MEVIRLSKDGKILERMRRNASDIRKEEAERILLMLGYFLDGQKGSHRQYRHKRKRPFTLVWETPVKRYLVQEIIQLVDEG